jgi:hypothetical protein
MTSDQTDQATPVTAYHQGRNYTGAFVAISMFLAFLFVANLYTLSKLNTARQSQESLRSALSKEIKELQSKDEQLAVKFSLFEETHRRQIDALRGELDTAAARLGSSTGQVLDRARVMVAALGRDQERQAEDLKEQLSQKASADELGALSENVSAAQAELGTTKKTVDVLAKDLGMARSQLGTLIATNSGEISALRELGERDYFEFTLAKNQISHISGLVLVLRKTNLRNHRFNLDLVVNDQEIRTRNRNVNEPIYFYVNGLKTPYELVINEVEYNRAKGYISTPKGALAAEDGSTPGRQS